MTNNFVNEHYTTQVATIKSALKKENVVQLQEFLDKEAYYELLSVVKKTKLKKDVDVFEHKYSSGSIKLPSEITGFFKNILGKNLSYNVVVLEHGDYSLIHDKKVEVIIDLTSDWLNGWGGYVMYNDGEGNVLKIPAKQNSVTISNGKTFGSIKYVNNHSSKNKKIYVVGR